MAGRPRKPTNVLILQGADKVNPARIKERENEPINVNPIGKVPAWLSTAEKKEWAVLVHDAIDGVLGEADRSAVAITAKLLHKYKQGEANGQEQSLLNKYLGQMGMLPTERTKIQVPKKEAKNIFADD